MTVYVDQDTCTGCGLCPDICPEMFEMKGDKAQAKKDMVPEELADQVQDAAESCPVEAICTDE